MAKKIRFPLEMENGIEVRSIEELQVNFSVPRVMEYIRNGKMATWLRDRYEDERADLVEALDLESEDVTKQVCEIFEVEYNSEAESELQKAAERVQRLAQLHELAPNSERFDKNIDFVAFEQDELYDLLDEDADTVYLCGEKFVIPTSRKNLHYVGINNPIVTVNSKNPVDFALLGITFDGVVFDEKIKSMVKSEEDTNKNETGLSIAGSGIKIPDDTGDQLFDSVAKILNEIDLDLFNDTRKLKEQLLNVGFIGIL